jgi:hypothetical protein
MSGVTLTEFAAILGADKVMREPERFLIRQIKSGKIRARKVGRHWVMTEADVEFALEAFGNAIKPEAPPVEVVNGLSSGSARRRLAVAG